MTSAPYLTWKRTASRKLAAPAAMPVGDAGLRAEALVGEAGVVAVAAARAEGVHRDQHARAGDDAGVDGVAQADVDVVARADVAHGGEPAITVRRAYSVARTRVLGDRAPQAVASRP